MMLPTFSTPRRNRPLTSRQHWKTGDADFVRDALGIVAKARGMGQVAKTADLNRESLYKALSETGLNQKDRQCGGLSEIGSSGCES